MIIPGLVSATFKTESPDYVLDALQKADLHAVEWSENWHIPAGDTHLAAELRERTLAQGAEVAAYGSYYRLGENASPEKDFLPTLQNAAALHAPLIRIWGGGTASADKSPCVAHSVAPTATKITLVNSYSLGSLRLCTSTKSKITIGLMYVMTVANATLVY